MKINEFPNQQRTKAELLEDIRQKRNTLIVETDPMAALDHPKYGQPLLAYREALRNLPQVYADNPEDVIFPIAPWL